MEDRGITCEAEDCAFSTPDMGAEWYPAMVTHLQVHAATRHGISMGGMIPAHVRATASAMPADVPRQRRSSTGVRSRSRSRRRDMTLAFPCPDCKTRSFASEAGLYAHRILICGLRDKEKPTSLDYKCTSCPRAFTTPIGVASHRRYCRGRELGSGGEGEVARGRAGVGGEHTVSQQEECQVVEASGVVRPGDGRGGSGGRVAADQEQENQGPVAERSQLGAGGAGGDNSGGSGVVLTAQNPDYMAHVTGPNKGLGSSGQNVSGETSRLGLSGSSNTSKVVKKRSNTEVPTSSKRSKSEVWVLAGRGDQDQGNHGLQGGEALDQGGEALGHGAPGKKGELGNGLASNSSETPRSTTTGAVSSSARRRLEVSASGSNQPRSQTSHQALASGSHQGSSGRRTMDGGVTMQVEMVTVNGMESITYRVKLTTLMQKVIDKVAIRLGKRAAQVLLTRDGNLVDPTAMAAIYTNTKLVASVV